ncbi:partial DNA-directed RNA polymerase subunit beta, partial [Candidatus Brocadiaceae bacterium]
MNTIRHSFSRINPVLDIPDLLDVQKASFEDFLQLNIPPAQRENKGLQQVFTVNFPIFDNKENYRLDFLEYAIDRPRYSITECLEKGLTYAAPLKAKLRLSAKDPVTGEFIQSTDQSDVYLGNLPFMTEQATFIINGAERVVVTQLHRSPGVAFSHSLHPNGTSLYSARIIPLKGSWVEFATDINFVLYVYIDRKKKFPATTLLRALGYQTDEEILSLFDIYEEVSVKDVDVETLKGRIAAADVFDMATGEIFLQRESIIGDDEIEKIKESEVDTIRMIRQDLSIENDLILNTLKKDISHTKEEALFSIYRQLRTGEAPDLESASGLLEKLFFNDKRYDLGEVGRHRMNNKLNLDMPETVTILTAEDIIE